MEAKPDDVGSRQNWPRSSANTIPSLPFVQSASASAFFISAVLVAMSAYEFYASGFGLIRELLHRGIYLAFMLFLLFLLFSAR